MCGDLALIGEPPGFGLKRHQVGIGEITVNPTPRKGLIILDRDGVINEMVIHPDHGIIDSPLHPDQVQVFPEVPALLRELNDLGYELAIATNQPAAAKGKTTVQNLEAVHQKIRNVIESQGAQIRSHQICLHRSEDRCRCRKPAPGMLEAAFTPYLGTDASFKKNSWMVGDGVTDVQAGAAFGVKTAYLGPMKCDARKIFEGKGVEPDFWGKDLQSFVAFLRQTLSSPD